MEGGKQSVDTSVRAGLAAGLRVGAGVGVRLVKTEGVESRDGAEGVQIRRFKLMRMAREAGTRKI